MEYTNVSNVVSKMDEIKKKIIFILPTLNRGGSERVLSTVANSLDVKKYNIIFITTNKSKDEFVLNNNIRYIRLNKKKLYFSFFNLLKIFFFEKPDTIFTCTTNISIIISLCTFFYRKNVKFILRESTIPSVASNYRKKQKWIIFLQPFLYKRYDLIICQCQKIKKDLLQNYRIKEEKLVIINNPLEFEKIEQGKIEQTLDFKGNGNSKILITVANLTSFKGHSRILEALKHIDTNFQYLIIGDGEEHEKLKMLSEQLGLFSKVKFLGTKINPFPYLYQSDLFLQGSFFEGFPNSLLEAGACGIPIVAYNCPGGTNEIIQEGINGFLVDNEANEIEFSNKIKYALSYNFKRNNIASLTQQKYKFESIIQKYEQIFDSYIINDKTN